MINIKLKQDFWCVLMNSVFKKLSSFQIIMLGFLSIILLGSLMLMLPISTADRSCANFFDALFTSVSATCVTGLVVHDTATYWSGFGQTIILILIQIGGLGVVSAAAAISMLSGRRINLRQRSIMQEAISAPKVGGIVKLTGFILKTVLLIELFGCIVMLPAFCGEFGFLKGLWYSVFHSISAFCNAGFDLMGVKAPYSSLTFFAYNPLINITVILLIIVGGLGFSTWEDIKIHKFHLKYYHLQSKIILSVTAVLIVLPFLYFYFFEFSEWDMSSGGRFLVSFFQTVTPRTAGFNTVDFSLMRESSIAVMIVLMLIGGSTGSTAGGLKTTTIGVLLAMAVSVFKRKEDVTIFKRRIENSIIKKASALILMYLFLFFTGGVLISMIDELPLLDCLFETASAIGTVGLSTGITSSLGICSRIILILLMFFGRVGGLTFIFAAISQKQDILSKYPLEKINIG